MKFNNSILLLPSADPYDLWATAWGRRIKKAFYRSSIKGKISAVLLGSADWQFPALSRLFFRCRNRRYPIVISQEILRRSVQDSLNKDKAVQLLNLLKSIAVDPTGKKGWAWGLGFPWMSKNGYYPEVIPFITHTPYAMEALLALSAAEIKIKDESFSLFLDTWNFLEKLVTMYDRRGRELALSYAPIVEPRIVVNANAYAAYAYSLHAVYGRSAVRERAKDKALKLARWITIQQRKNGSWLYYADDRPGNFTDCFHSCFVIKNLLKICKLFPADTAFLSLPIQNGWYYLRNNFYDDKVGLYRRFTIEDIRSPFQWDLYDQAEYIGLLIDFKKYNEALSFSRNVKEKFYKHSNWFCKIDIFGRCWGKNYLRWGIMPFLYNNERLKKYAAEVS